MEQATYKLYKKPIPIRIAFGDEYYRFKGFKEVGALAEINFRGYKFYLNDHINFPAYRNVTCAITGLKIPLPKNKQEIVYSHKMQELTKEVEFVLKANWFGFQEAIKRSVPINSDNQIIPIWLF